MGLELLSRRELSEAQLRARLARRHYEHAEVDDAIGRLRDDHTLDDRRVAMICARAEAGARHRGRLRVLKRLAALGINRDVAHQATDAVYGEIDEDVVLERALDKRLRQGGALDDPRAVERLQRSLLAQGFEPSRIKAIIEERAGKRVR
jgi:regulatory protein